MTCVVNINAIFGLQVEKPNLQVSHKNLEHSVSQFSVRLGRVQSQQRQQSAMTDTSALERLYLTVYIDM